MAGFNSDIFNAISGLADPWIEARQKQQGLDFINSGVPAAQNPFAFAVTPAGGAQGGAPSADASPATPGGPTQQAYAYGKFLEAGHTPQSAAAMVANLSGESGRALRADAMNNSGTETPGAVNARGSYGIAQWNGYRQFGLLQYARATGGDPRSLDTQIGFVDHELKTQYPDLYAASRDPNASSQALLQRYVADYERPADVAGGVRQRSQYLGLNYGSAAPAGRGVQLAGPIPTPDTGAAPVSLTPKAATPGFQAIAPQGAPAADDVAGAKSILADPVSPPNARAYAQDVLNRAGSGAQAAPAPTQQAAVDPEQARWQARTSPPGGPQIPDGAPLPPPRPAGLVGNPTVYQPNTAAAPAQQQAQQQLPQPHQVASVAQHAARAGFDPVQAIGQFFNLPLQVAQNLFGSLFGQAQAAPAQGVVPDGRGGMVPASNSRVAADGSFLPGGGQAQTGTAQISPQAYQASMLPDAPASSRAAPLQQPYMAPQAAPAPMITAFGRSYPLDQVMRMYANPIYRPIAGLMLEQAGKTAGPIKLSAGEVLLDPRTGQPIYRAPSGDAATSEIKNYEYYRAHGGDASFDDWTQQNKRASGAGGGAHVLKPGDKLIDNSGKPLYEAPPSANTMSDETADFLAERVLAGDRTALQNLGRSAQGSENIAKVQGLVAQKAAERGLDAKSILDANSEQQGYTAQQRTFGTQTARMATSSIEAQGAIMLGRDASAKVARTQWMPVNKAVQAYEMNAGDPDLAKFGAANLAIINTYARAINPNGAPTVADKEHANAMLSTAQSPEQYNAVLDQMNAEIELAHKSPEVAQKMLKNIRAGKPAMDGLSIQSTGPDGQPTTQPLAPQAGAPVAPRGSPVPSAVGGFGAPLAPQPAAIPGRPVPHGPGVGQGVQGRPIVPRRASLTWRPTPPPRRRPVRARARPRRRRASAGFVRQPGRGRQARRTPERTPPSQTSRSRAKLSALSSSAAARRAWTASSASSPTRLRSSAPCSTTPMGPARPTV